MTRFLLKHLLMALLLALNNLGIRSLVLKDTTLLQPSLETKIIGGLNASIEEFSFQFSLLFKGHFSCSGSVLSENWAITAAHCVSWRVNMPELFTLRLNSSYHASCGKVVNVSSIHLHPFYNTNVSLNYDVALLYAKDNLLSDAIVQPIGLPAAEAPISAGIAVNISGWGSTGMSPNSTVLQYATVNLVDQYECCEKYANLGKIITDNMFCAAVDGVGTCYGDSGGPIQTNNTLLGIVSWGEGCACYPGVYANVAYPDIRDWIHSLTGL